MSLYYYVLAMYSYVIFFI